jgi:hypothetical protein
MARFQFRFATPYRLAGLPFGVTPTTTMVEATDDEFRVRFGPWLLRTDRGNIAGCTVTGPYSFVKTAGPAHLSFSDSGLTCATNGTSGACVRFAEPVRAIDPWGRIRHPAITVTVERPDELCALLQESMGSSGAA